MKAKLILILALAGLHCSVFDDEGDSADLKQIWRKAASGDASSSGKSGVDGQYYYEVRDRKINAYRISNGMVAWSRSVSTYCWTALAREGRVFCPGHRLEAFDAASGAPLWNFTPDSTLSLTEGAIDVQRVYSGSLRGTVYAHDAATGALVWQRAFREPSWVGADIRGLTVSGDTLFVGLTRHYTQNAYLSAALVVALDAATGRELWRFQDGDGTDSRSVSRRAPTVSGRMVLYANNNAGEYTAFDRTTRQVVWRVKEEPGYVGPYQAPEVVNGIGYGSGGDQNVYAIDVATGVIKWKTKPAYGSNFSHAVCGDVLLVNNSGLVVVDLATGRKRGLLFDPVKETGERVQTLDVRDGRAYVSTSKGAYAYECPQ